MLAARVTALLTDPDPRDPTWPARTAQLLLAVVADAVGDVLDRMYAEQMAIYRDREHAGMKNQAREHAMRARAYERAKVELRELLEIPDAATGEVDRDVSVRAAVDYLDYLVPLVPPAEAAAGILRAWLRMDRT